MTNRGYGTPNPDRPELPESYGVPETIDGVLSWEHVVRRMSESRNYWLATVRRDYRPHAVPVWGVWLDDTIHFGGGRGTRKARNLSVNSGAVVHAESGEDVVILEGMAEEVTDGEQQARIDDAYEAKYGIRHGTPVWVLKPRVAYAWSAFPGDATRWLLGDRR